VIPQISYTLNKVLTAHLGANPYLIRRVFRAR